MWFHVTYDRQNRVTQLDLGNARLSGTLVGVLGRLTSLQLLELYKNNIKGKIRKELGNLKSLISLDLYQNNLTGKIPETLGDLKSLRFLFFWLLGKCLIECQTFLGRSKLAASWRVNCLTKWQTLVCPF